MIATASEEILLKSSEGQNLRSRLNKVNIRDQKRRSSAISRVIKIDSLRETKRPFQVECPPTLGKGQDGQGSHPRQVLAVDIFPD